MNRLPCVSNAMPCGTFRDALEAAPPSPPKPAVPVPATVVMTGAYEGELVRVPDAVAVGDAVRVGVTLTGR